MPDSEFDPDEDRREGRAAMLRDIEAEIGGTRREIGREAFSPRVMTAMANVPREEFVPLPFRPLAFANGPLPIGHGQTISQPYIVALMTDLLQAGPEAVILEVGTGSGYQAAVLAALVRQVYSIEIVEPLAGAATKRFQRLGIPNVEVRHGDGWHGWPEHAPYDGIIVTAAAPAVPPPLIDQLKPGARLVIPVGMPGDVQVLQTIEKLGDGTTKTHDMLLVAFVPLTRAAAPA